MSPILLDADHSFCLLSTNSQFPFDKIGKFCKENIKELMYVTFSLIGRLWVIIAWKFDNLGTD